MIPDQGSLKETPPARLLLALYEQNQTGILYFRQNEILKVFYLNRGKISWAISSDEEDRIEHVLLARKLISPEVLAPYQSNNKITQSFGKVLVENGVLSLEGLINATREQVRHIAASIMRWSNGNYQLVHESPPTRLVSLDLEIPGLVASYVLEQMDMNIAWEELGAQSGELQQNLEPGKKNLYPLNPEQQEVYSRFSQPQRLESVLLEFPAERKYRILKILYYFLLTGLLDKKEPEKMPSLDFGELDSLFGQNPPGSPAEVDIEMPAMINEAEIKDIPLAELPEIPAVKDEMEDTPEHLELPDLMPPGVPEAREDAPMAAEAPEAEASEKEARRPAPHPFLKPEKPKPRWLSVTFLSILVAAVLVGLFLWFTRAGDKPEESPQAASPRTARRRPAPQKPATVPPQETSGVQGGSAPTTGAMAEPNPAGSGTPRGETATGKARPAEVKKAPAIAPATGNAKPAEVKIPPAVETAGAGEAQARQRFAAGDFRAAGDIWRQEIRAARFKFSILLELDCLKESVRGAYRQLVDKDNFFLLNRSSRDGRSCYLVLWGRYRTADEAALGMKQLPDYFAKQSNPASIIELEPYL